MHLDVFLLARNMKHLIYSTHTRRESETFSVDASCALCSQAFEANAGKKYAWANYTQILIIIITAQHVKWLIWHRIDRKCVGLSSIGVWVKCRLPSGYRHKRCQMNETEQKSLANSWSVRIYVSEHWVQVRAVCSDRYTLGGEWIYAVIKNNNMVNGWIQVHCSISDLSQNLMSYKSIRRRQTSAQPTSR